MQLATRTFGFLSQSARAPRATKKVVQQQQKKMTAGKKQYHSRSAALYSAQETPNIVPSRPPPEMTAEEKSFNHLEIPADITAEAIKYRDELLALEAEEEKMAEADLLSTVATQVGLIQKTAEALNKDIRDVTALDVATFRLQEHEKFVSTVELDKVVLFSHEKALENFQEGAKVLSSLYEGGVAPAWLAPQLKKIEATLAERVANQEIIEISVEEDVYKKVQENLFPSFVKKGITPQEYLDYVGGSDGLIDPVSFHVRDLMVQLKSAPTDSKGKILADLQKSMTAFEDAEGEEYTDSEKQALVGLAWAQDAAVRSMSMKLGLDRDVTLGDLNPERRLQAGALEVHHPILSTNPTFYVHGDITNLSESVNKLLMDEHPNVQFEPRADFNPPTAYRELTAEHLAAEPTVHKELQEAALNFPMWEGQKAASAINSAELIVEMKLYKLFNYMFPALSDSAEAQALFMETFDVSPGEPTLEWALSYPTKEHTFFPEHPLWVNVFEDDEEVPAIQWPSYNPIVVEGPAEISSAPGGHSVSVKFFDAPEAIAAEAHFHAAFNKLSADAKATLTMQGAADAIKALSASEKSAAEAEWAKLDSRKRQAIRQSWQGATLGQKTL